MRKVIKLKRNAKVFYDMAEDKLEKGEYDSSASYFYQSYLLDRNVNSLLGISETYAEIGQPQEALKYLFMALDAEPSSDDICEMIAACFAGMDDEDMAFFYVQPGMSVKRFRHIMAEAENAMRMENPDIRVVEKNDDMLISIAAKLIESGDTRYAKEILLTVQPSSAVYPEACNILSLCALSDEKPAEALEHINKALEIRDTAELRCTELAVYHALGDAEAVKRVTARLESFPLDMEDKKAAALAYVRVGDAERAAKHLRSLLDINGYSRDALISYALALYNSGRTDEAKQRLLYAHRLYPEDVTAPELLMAVSRGDELSLFPMLPDKTVDLWFGEIDRKLEVMKSGGGDLSTDTEFVQKLMWLFQSHFPVRQGKAILVLARYSAWRDFLRRLLLSLEIEVPVKKICLYALLRYSDLSSAGIVLDGMYTRLKIKYPQNMNELFRAAYCLAFASLAIADTAFESRFHTMAGKLAARYNSDGFDRDAIKSEEALAAVMFYATGHKDINKALHCSHIFGCEYEEMCKYLAIFNIKK